MGQTEQRKVIEMSEIEELRQQLAASQAKVVLLRLCLQTCVDYGGMTGDEWVDEKAKQALAIPQDTSALEVMIAKAGEVMRERCVRESTERYAAYLKSGYERQAQATSGLSEAIRTLPAVTLEDLQK